MKKAPGREAAEADKSCTKTSTKRSAENRIAPKTARTRTFDPDALLNSMEGMVFVASADLRLEYMNETALRKLGRDMTGRPCHKALHGLDERCPWCRAGLVLQGQTIRQEVRGQRDGRWYSSVMTPIHREDGSVAIQSLVFDITDQKLAEAARVISSEAGALQLRFLQTLTEVATEKNSTIIFPIPIDLIKPFLDRAKN